MGETDAIAERILRTFGTITVVGASADNAKPAHYVPAHMQQHGWRVIPVNPHADEILGERVYRTVGDVPVEVGLVNVFRPAQATPEVARQAVAAHATALWLQLGIVSDEELTGLPSMRLDTLMGDAAARRRVAEQTLSFAEALGG